MRITKVTTKTGDSGETGLGNGERVSKNSPRVHAMGAVDKLNSIIGWTRTKSIDKIDKYLEKIQQDLFNIGGELAIPDVDINLLDESRLNWLEEKTETLNNTLPPLNEFILPGGNEYASRLHISRAECRESERLIIALSQDEYVPEMHKKYINRLSDFLFVLARIAMMEKGDSEISWEYK
tara:strand:+ start:619 stop:1158 length:540 start_codon:yes stop_codon:yes gene_type:complete